MYNTSQRLDALQESVQQMNVALYAGRLTGGELGAGNAGSESRLAFWERNVGGLGGLCFFFVFFFHSCCCVNF